jgi:replication factor A1
LTASWFCFVGWFRDKDERVDAEKASRKSETKSRESCRTQEDRTKTRSHTFQRSTSENRTENRGKNLEDSGGRILKIRDLRDEMRRVDVEAKVIQKSETREVSSRYKDETYKVADAMIRDDTGAIKLTLWNEQIDQVNLDDTVRIENGYITSFRGQIQLNVGKYGKLTIL